MWLIVLFISCFHGAWHCVPVTRLRYRYVHWQCLKASLELASDSQVGSAALSRVLKRLPPQKSSDQVVCGLEALDDAAVVRPPPPGHLLLQTVDFLPSFISDLHEFGAVAANHALSVSPYFSMEH